MLFFRVKKEPHWIDYKITGITRELVLGELITAAEIKRFKYEPLHNFMTAVEVSKRATYWLFGARFEIGYNPHKPSN